MISYGDVFLSIGDGELHALIERGLDPIGELREFQNPEWNGINEWKTPEATSRRHPPLYRLYWPRGASRWSEAHFLATEEELDAIRGKAYRPDQSTGLLPLNLKIDDGTKSISTSMYMMPPRPLFQVDPDLTKGKNLYLLTLVDVRYWWWRRSAAIYVTPGTTTWEQLYGMIANSLGITIIVDEIPSEYLKPPIQIQNLYFHIPPMLDAVAYSVGQRIVRGLDGVVHAQNASTGIGRQAANYSFYKGAENINFGGKFRFDRTLLKPDLPPLVPDTVRTVFPQLPVTSTIKVYDPCGAEECIPGRKYYEKGLTELAVTEYGSGKNTMPGFKIFHSTAIAWLSNIGTAPSSVISNAAILQALNDQLGRDWYLWQLGYMSQVFAGVVPWNESEAEGASDYVEWEATPNKMRTFVMREAMNDLAFKVYHYTPNPGMSDPYPPTPPVTVPMACNGADEVPTTLYMTLSYGTATISLPMTFDGLKTWRYQGGDVTLCSGLDVREIALECDTTLWTLTVITVNFFFGDGQQEALGCTSTSAGDLAILNLNDTNPVNYLTSTNAEYQTGCGLQYLFIAINGAPV